MFLAALAAGSLVLSGCAGTPAGTAGQAAPDSNGGALTSVTGFDAATKTITVGTMIPTSGVWEAAVANIDGAKAYFHRVTQPGAALEGYKIEVKNVDTEYNPSVAVPLYGQLQNEVLMINQLLGTAIAKALLPQIQADNMLAVLNANDEGTFKDPNFLTFGPFYGVYHAAAVQYLADEEDMKGARFCALLQDDDFGSKVEDGFAFATQELGLDRGISVRYPTGHSDFTPQIARLQKDGCEVVDLGGAGAVVQNAATRAVQLNFDATWLAGNTAYNNTLATGPAADYIKKHVKFLVTGTEWGDHSVPGQKMLEDDLAATLPDAVPVANAYQTGYAAAVVTSAVIEKGIADGDLSREHLLQVAQSLGTHDDFGLMGGKFVYGNSPSDRRPSTKISVFSVSEDAPTGLKLQKFGFESDVAVKYSEKIVADSNN